MPVKSYDLEANPKYSDFARFFKKYLPQSVGK